MNALVVRHLSPRTHTTHLSASLEYDLCASLNLFLDSGDCSSGRRDTFRLSSPGRNLDNLATFYCVDRSEPPADHLSLQLGARIANCAKRRGCSRYGKVLLFTCFCFFFFSPLSLVIGRERRGETWRGMSRFEIFLIGESSSYNLSRYLRIVYFKIGRILNSEFRILEFLFF